MYDFVLDCENNELWADSWRVFEAEYCHQFFHFSLILFGFN